MEEHQTEAQLVSYMTHRRIIGYMGFFLPATLAALGWWLKDLSILRSISAYYHVQWVGAVFVGTLCAIGVFLLAYKGYPPRPRHQQVGKVDPVRHRLTDNRAANVAGICAIGLAWVPTAAGPAATGLEGVLDRIHLAFTLGHFLALIYMAAVLFTMTHHGQQPKPEKQKRNDYYKACAAIMASCLLLICLVKFKVLPASFGPIPAVFLLEAVAIMSFGVAWFVKGQVIPLFRDRDE